jgi:uncharacterized protein with NRDE domain
MCVIFFALGHHAEHPLILLANRDEFYRRPTEPARRWTDHPEITAGRDLAAGGTWLGVTDAGRFAAVTNYREPQAPKGVVSRGNLVANFLRSDETTASYLRHIQESAGDYSGFNLIVGEISDQRRELYHFSNRGDAMRELEPGVYGLSNHLLDSSWPKVAAGKRRFAELIAERAVSKEKCFRLLADETVAEDAELPDTGVGLERERTLSPIFIRTPVYGTRSSTVLIFDQDSSWELEEKVFV